MKVTRRRKLIGSVLIVVLAAGLYGYRIARAERHRALDRACASGDVSRVGLLLRLGADPNGVNDAAFYSRYSWTVFETMPPLHTSAAGGHTNVVRLLLEHGANPGRLSSEQMTAGAIARLKGHSDLARTLDDAQSE